MRFAPMQTNRPPDRSREPPAGPRTGAAMSKHKVQVRRVYDDPARGDGNRVLVDRI